MAGGTTSGNEDALVLLLDEYLGQPLDASLGPGSKALAEVCSAINVFCPYDDGKDFANPHRMESVWSQFASLNSEDKRKGSAPTEGVTAVWEMYAHDADSRSRRVAEIKDRRPLIRALIEEYDKTLIEHRKLEQYKWEAVVVFQDTWDPDAEDFPKMLDKALSQSANLLAGGNYFARKMLVEYAEFDAVGVREALQGLFQEEEDLVSRMKAFSGRIDAIHAGLNAERAAKGEKEAANSYQDPRAMNVYLTLNNPADHFFYKCSMLEACAKRLGIAVPYDKYEKVPVYEDMCREILDTLISEYPGLVEFSDALLGPTLASFDPEHHILVQDIVFFAEAYAAKAPEGDGPSHWVYAPGENAWAWQECLEDGVMLLGWDDLGDLAQYSTRESINDAAGDDGDHKNIALACWEFQNVMKPGDYVYAKRGRSAVLGRGVVQSDAYYDESRERYTHVRDVEWIDAGEWPLEGFPLPMKTLTRWDEYPELKELKALFEATPEPDAQAGPNHWFLVAKESYWSFDSLEGGRTEQWTAYNEDGNKRRVFANIKAVRKGDKFIGYHSSPTLAAICTVEALTDFEDKGPCLDSGFYIGNMARAKTPVTYSQMKADPLLKKMQYITGNPTGSLFRLTEEQYNRLAELMGIAEPSEAIGTEGADAYCDDDFLRDVYVDDKKLADMKLLLKRKKNIVLHGSPGTGKTYAAKRLAWCLMGEKAYDRMCMVQFHQSSAYDDFVIGYRPDGSGGFKIKKGPFVEFCEMAANDKHHDYFLIIDEINRANISKVFGELLMLIEAGHRGDELLLPLGDQALSVPENLYIIGMMNTADRGLALIDYALRRRFGFVEMEPAFGNEAFEEALRAAGDPKLERLARAVEKLNAVIEEDPALGRGFRIGHSYFDYGDGECDEAFAESVVRYELAPLVREYWFDDEKKANTEVENLEDAVK